jgi:uncharacterized SAM-binding protein YcdF (DUF218 family)
LKRFKRIAAVALLFFAVWFGFTAYSVFSYSSDYSEQKSDVAIVLGASSQGSEPSPVFKERLNHALYLYTQGIAGKILLTGGYGSNASESESYIAKLYLLSAGVPDSVIYIEQVSQNTLENMVNAQKVMQKQRLHSALIVSDPLHMKRAMRFAENLELDALPSPTQTSMYRSKSSKIKFLISESFFLMASYLIKPDTTIEI